MKNLMLRIGVTATVLATVIGGVSVVDGHAQDAPQATKQYCC